MVYLPVWRLRWMRAGWLPASWQLLRVLRGWQLPSTAVPKRARHLPSKLTGPEVNRTGAIQQRTIILLIEKLLHMN